MAIKYFYYLYNNGNIACLLNIYTICSIKYCLNI